MTHIIPQKISTLFLIAFAALLTACQTVPPQTGFTPEQVAVLKAEGFVDQGFDWSLSMPERLLFQTNESAISSEQQAQIARIAARLVGVGITNARVEGHTDSVGAADYNLKLSKARADAVAAPMQAAGMPLSPDRIVGRGEDFPMSSNDTEEGRQDNRRVVVIVSPE
ncbi:MAG: OmpA family protein [Sphingopyxis solisilvae]|uniref:OmpA family protein n=1 Tax=Sphingopyxis solisilvae TaxID=1886788 RepID=UPI004035DBB3